MSNTFTGNVNPPPPPPPPPDPKWLTALKSLFAPPPPRTNVVTAEMKRERAKKWIHDVVKKIENR